MLGKQHWLTTTTERRLQPQHAAKQSTPRRAHARHTPHSPKVHPQSALPSALAAMPRRARLHCALTRPPGRGLPSKRPAHPLESPGCPGCATKVPALPVTASRLPAVKVHALPGAKHHCSGQLTVLLQPAVRAFKRPQVAAPRAPAPSHAQAVAGRPPRPPGGPASSRC